MVPIGRLGSGPNLQIPKNSYPKLEKLPFGPASSTCTFQLHGSKLAWSPQDLSNILLPSDIRCDLCSLIWVVVSNIFYFQPYLGQWSNLTSIFFKRGWNHQSVMNRILTSSPPKKHPENGEGTYPSKVGRTYDQVINGVIKTSVSRDFVHPSYLIYKAHL